MRPPAFRAAGHAREGDSQSSLGRASNVRRSQTPAVPTASQASLSCSRLDRKCLQRHAMMSTWRLTGNSILRFEKKKKQQGTTKTYQHSCANHAVRRVVVCVQTLGNGCCRRRRGAITRHQEHVLPHLKCIHRLIFIVVVKNSPMEK